jgi:hypothetical protein
MLTHRIVALIGGLLLLSGCTTGLRQSEQKLTDIPVKSSEIVAASPYNNKIEQAIRNGEKWPLSPLKLVITLLNAEAETREITILKTADVGENAKHVVVTIIRDGFLDDSVRGDLHRFILERKDDETWRVSDVRKSRRCWRPEIKCFHSGKCQ